MSEQRQTVKEDIDALIRSLDRLLGHLGCSADPGRNHREALRNIGLALNACHGTVTTDRTDAEPDATSWRIDHKREIELLQKLERDLLSAPVAPPYVSIIVLNL